MADDFVVSLSSNKRIARLEIMEGNDAVAFIDCDSAMLSTCIAELGRVRAAMADPIPRKLDPNPTFKDVTRGAVFHVNRQHVVSKEFFIAVRHEGFGWLAFAMPDLDGEILVNLINRQIEAMRPKIIQPNKGIIT